MGRIMREKRIGQGLLDNELIVRSVSMEINQILLLRTIRNRMYRNRCLRQ